MNSVRYVIYRHYSCSVIFNFELNYLFGEQLDLSDNINDERNGIVAHVTVTFSGGKCK